MVSTRHSHETVARMIAAYDEHKSSRIAAIMTGMDERSVRRIYADHKAGRDVFEHRVPSEVKSLISGNPPDPDEFGRLILGDLPDCVLVLPDLQFPFAHPDWLPFLTAVREKYRPTLVIGIGDEVDSYCLSSYDKDPETMQPSYEYGRALEELAHLYELFPNVLALHSNHGIGRLEKARIRGGFLRAQVLDYQQFIRAPKGWNFYREVRLGDVIFHHGDGEKKLTRAFLERDIPEQYGRHYSIVHGHRHESAGRQAEISVGDNSFWASYTGCLINPHAPAFQYTKARKAKLGCGLVIHGEFKRVRMIRNDRNRWTGEL